MIYKSKSSILEMEAPVVPDTSLLHLSTNRDFFLDLLLPRVLLLPRDARVSGDVVVSFIILVMLCLLLFVYTEVILMV